MAHSSLHFALGLAIGTGAFLPAILKHILTNRKVALLFRKWLLVSYSLGIFSIIPNLLRRAGCPETMVEGWWMNLFIFHPLIDRIKEGGMIIGEFGIISCFLLQYLLLLAAITRRKRLSAATIATS